MKAYLSKPKVVIVMPAYNAEKTIEKTYKAIPKGLADEIIVIDDKSHDKTVEIAKKLALNVFLHKENLGYGGNQKTCYQKALEMKADIIVMIHPDYQYDPRFVGSLIKPIIDKKFDIMLGSRIRTRKEALNGGMPLYKYIGNRFLTLIENFILGLNLSEYHTGFRAYRKEVLLTLPFKSFSNDFVFDQEMLIVAHLMNFKIGEIPVSVYYFPEASSINFFRSVKYGIMTLYTLILYFLVKNFWVKIKIFKIKKIPK